MENCWHCSYEKHEVGRGRADDGGDGCAEVHTRRAHDGGEQLHVLHVVDEPRHVAQRLGEHG